MSDERLSADLSARPSDFYQVLGVRRGVSRRQLRQAYTTLLRRFKPEHFPDHFRRLRDAYEAVLRHVQWQEQREAHNAGRSPGEHELPPAAEASSNGAGDISIDDPATTGDREPDQDSSTPRRAGLASNASWHDQFETLWNQAVAGDGDAYLRLAALEPQNPGRREIYIRLYWLLVVWPHLDPERDPCDWLARGMRAGRLTGPAAELYRRELDEHPTETLSPRCLELLNCPAEPGHLADLVEGRWQAAGRLDRLDVILADLTQLRSRFLPSAEELWARLLLAALDQLVWAVSPTQQTLADAVWEELEGIEHLQIDLRHALDRVDLLRSVAAGCRSLRGSTLVPGEFLELIRQSWLRPPHEIEPRVLHVLGQFSADPRVTLALFDRIRKASSSVLAQLGQMIENCTARQPAATARPDVEHIQTLARLSIEARSNCRYETLRWHLLEFCLREQVDPV